jgi:hypothetical protein
MEKFFHQLFLSPKDLAMTLEDTSQLQKDRNLLYESWLDGMIYLSLFLTKKHTLAWKEEKHTCQLCTNCCPVLTSHPSGHHALLCHSTHTSIPASFIKQHPCHKHLLTFCGSSWDGNHVTSRGAYILFTCYQGVVVSTYSTCLYHFICPLLNHNNKHHLF